MMIATHCGSTQNISHSGLKLEFVSVCKMSACYAYVQLKACGINEQQDLILCIYYYYYYVGLFFFLPQLSEYERNKSWPDEI